MVLWSAALSYFATLAIAEIGSAFKLHGHAWFEGGRIMTASDSLINGVAPDNALNLNGNILQSPGAQITAFSDISDNLEGVFGFGVHKSTHAMGNDGRSALLAISLYQSFLTQSRLTYFQGEKSDPEYSFTLGLFPFKYNRDVKNLGMYLLRGPVYPGILMGGFQDFAVDSTKGTMLGLNIHHKMGRFSHDLILNSERDIPPTFDWSLAYIAKVKLGAMELGAGTNFYRLLPYDSKLTTPGKHFTNAELGFKKDRYVEVAPGSTDTVFFTHQGTKVMGMFSLDMQKLLGVELFHPDDMKIYGEAAVLGTKDYGETYGDIKKRIPAMIGFNIPTGGWLNHLSLEVEYYGATYRNDLARIGNNNTVAPWTIQAHPIPSPKPVGYVDYGIDTVTGIWVRPDFNDPSKNDTVRVFGTAMDKANQTKDNLKWSLIAEKIISNHISVLVQVANDHYRPKSVAKGLIKSEGGTQEAFASPQDWYFMFRMGFFF